MDSTPVARATEARKSRHLDICLEDDVRSQLDAGFSAVRLRHEALPECALDDVDLTATLVGQHLRAPFLISSMTGGTDRARTINRNLAVAAERAGIALALGSQRAALENPALLRTYAVRDIAPNVVLFSNIGAVQFNYGLTIDDARTIVDNIEANGLYIHLNPLQEALQPNGDTNFRGLLARISALCRTLDVPVIAKSVGSGISVSTATRLLEAGVAAIDVAGAGGTSWARVEGRRADDPRREELAETFSAWGYPTVEAVIALRVARPSATIVASGGVRSGVDAAKALAVGADAAAAGLPFLDAATRSAEAVSERLDFFITGLRIAMFASGCRRIADLRDARYVRGSDETLIADPTI